MTPRLIAFYEGAEYARMARVLAHSAARHCRDWDVRIEKVALFTNGQITADERVRYDTSKLLRWTEAVEQAPDNTPMLLIDCDVMILRSLDDIWDRPFDVAYTVRDKSRTPLPLNAGIVFVRATAAARRFLRAWYETTQPIRSSKRLRQIARKQFGACDQAGLASVLKMPAVTAGVALVPLPCREWNCEDSEWGRFDPSLTRLVHIKGALRDAVLGKPVRSTRTDQVQPLAATWRALEREARV